VNQHLHFKRRKETLNHINRISGQIETLKGYVQTDASCEDVASLTTSIAKSFDALRVRTLEGFILNEIVNDDTDKEKIEQLKKLMNLHKK
jgi:DNA-binding FrmR family transcriptional regulator